MVRAERPQARERVRIERRADRVDRRERVQERAAERRARSVERVRPLRAERQERSQRVERRARVERAERRENRGLERAAFVHERNRERFAAKREQQLRKQLDKQTLRAERRELRNDLQRMASRSDFNDRFKPLLGVAQPLAARYQDYNVPSAYRSLYYDTPYEQFRYDNGAIYQVDPKTQAIQSVVALLTGRNLVIGQMMPAGYDVYNVPYAYRDRFADDDDMWYRYSDGNIYGVDPYSRQIQSMYPINYGYTVGYPAPTYASYGSGYGGYGGYPAYSTPYGYQNLYYSQPGYNYQYGNGGIYQVDPTTQLVSALVALVTGANFGVGQQMPMGYDVYNVPSAYRSTYFDTADAWYRYDDGAIYQVDPRTRMIEAAIPLSYGGYNVGYPVPAAYPGYAVPERYDDLYYSAPGYDYRYFDGGIYAIDPDRQIVQSQVALLTGNTFGVGQMLPAGYDAYNLPFDYRDRYFDSDRAMYRYADGYIYQVDPKTRLIQAVIDAIV